MQPTDSILEFARLYHAEALEMLFAQPDGSADAMVTDPPYCAGAISESQRTRAPGQGLRSENVRKFGWFVGDNMGTAGLSWMMRAVACEARRVVKPTGSLLVFCDWRMVASLQPAIESAGVRFQGLIAWDKESMGLGTGFRAQHELILHFTLGAPAYHAADTGNVIRCRRVAKDEREHQTQKPAELMRRLIRVVTPAAGVVLDPFMGSGSTGVAAIAEGRRFVGSEWDADHYATAARRISESAGVGPGSLLNLLPDDDRETVEPGDARYYRPPGAVDR